MYQVEFKDALVSSFGGFRVKMNGLIKSSADGISIFSGPSGGGKSLLFSTIGWLHSAPGFASVEYAQRENIEIISKPIKKVALVRQEPLDNFVGGTLSSEFRLVFGDSLYDEGSFKRELAHILSKEFDIDGEMLSRHPRTMSSGEQQLIAISLAILSNADIILLDEPLARLSRKYTARVLSLLREQQGNRYILASIHLNDNIQAARMLSDVAFHSVELTEGDLKISQCRSRELNLVSGNINFDTLDTDSLLISRTSMDVERDVSKDFSILPDSSVRCIQGVGRSITPLPLNLELRIGDEALTSCRELSINIGINLLYGDNGAGKTLIARALAGNFPRRGALSRSKHIRMAGPLASLKLGGFKSLPDSVSLGWLRKQGLSFFLHSDPSLSLAERTVREEIEGTLNQKESKDRLEWLDYLGIPVDSQRVRLSYGLQKVVAFSTLPDEMVLVILDEIFANLSENLQARVSERIIKNVKSGSWLAAVITTNRPSDTLAALSLSHK